jgi:hypothetical protein
MTTPNVTNIPTNFDGIHVSKGFVRGLQGQVLRLEQNQQSLIRQLEHANKLASEYHATAVSWQHKYDQAMHKMGEMRHALERETLLRISREQELEHFKTLLQEQLTFTSNSGSPSPVHTHRDAPREPMSPVSIPSSPRKSATTNSTPATLSAHDNEFVKKQLLIEADTAIPFDENGERIIMRDGKKIKQSVCYGFGGMPWYDEKEMTTSEDEDSEDSALNEFYGNYYPNDAYSSQTTDCSGDPICHSDSD